MADKKIKAYERGLASSKKAAAEGQAALEASELRHRAIFESSRDAIFLLELAQDGPPVVRDVNAAGLKELGYSYDEVVGKPVSFLNEDPDAVRSIQEKKSLAQPGEGMLFEVRHKRKDGSVFTVEASAREMMIGGKRMAISVERDITERKRTEEALRESETKYRALIEQALDTILLLEMAPGGPPVIRDANPAALRLHGYTREELLGKPITFLDVDAPEALMRERLVRIETYGEAVFEARHRHKDGSALDFEVSIRALDIGGKRMLISLERDITKRKMAEAELNEAYEMQRVLNTMLQQSLENIPLREKLDKFLSVLFGIPWLAVQPRGAVFLMGAGGGSLVLTAQRGLAPDLLVKCAVVPLGRCLCGKVAESGKVVDCKEVDGAHHITYEGMAPHGHYCAPILAAGKVLGVLNLYLKAGQRLSETQQRFVKSVAHVMAETILHSRTEEKFSQAQKMESVGRLAGGVAHDFNNILGAIKWYAEFIRRDLKPGDPKLADAQGILASADRAAALTGQLLAFSRRQILKPTVLDLNTIPGNMTSMLSRLIGENLKLATRLFQEPCLALVDPGQIEQVIMNLVINSRDAMPGDGTITVETGLAGGNAAFSSAHPDLPPGQLVFLKVSDTGSGMTPEVKSRLFEPFFTTKEQGKGTGLGLSTVFGIVKQSGGEIEVESEPGRGTIFTIYLPRAEAEFGEVKKDKSEREDKVKGGAMKSGETVLLVEDEESLRRLGERVLLAGGYNVLTARDGTEALKVLEKRAKPVDLLLTDVVMPGMSGRELALELARRKMAFRTLYMSGYTDDAIVRHGVLEPGIALINKPFSVELLEQKVREVLDGPPDKAKA